MGRHPETTHEELKEGVLKVIEKLKIKHMPTVAQFRSIGDIELSTGKIRTGWQIYIRAANYDLPDLREEMELQTKTEYIRSVEKSVHNRRPVL